MRLSPLAVFLSPTSVAIRGTFLPGLLILTIFILCVIFGVPLAHAQSPVQAMVSDVRKSPVSDPAAEPAAAQKREAADAAPAASDDTVLSDPYLVFVAEESAHLRCGPAGEYYRTDPLRHGQELEVYVETADGWLGVRPTADSFCWIPADTARLLTTGSAAKKDNADALQAEITEEKTVAWIGTNLGRARRYRWQVQLGEGEIVTILGRSERDGPDGPQTWYRIVPPSGEFRWIHSAQVVTTAEELLAAVKRGGTEAPIEFLPGGPSELKPSTAQAPRGSGLRRVSDDQPYQEDANEKTTLSQEQSIAEIRRLDEIERNIEARSRSRFDRAGDPSGGEAAAGDRMSASGDAPGGRDLQPGEHHATRGFSQRISDGLSALVNGRQSGASDLQPLTGSSRRVPDLVAIGSGLASNTAGETSSPPASKPATSEVAGTGIVKTTPATPVVTADPKMVAATDHPELHSGQSQVAIMTAPRLVPQMPDANQSIGLASIGSMDQGGMGASSTLGFLPPAKRRTIDAAQLEEVQRSVAGATPDSLPLIMSSLMARGASAPEIRLIADAAQAFSLHDLAQRARDYEALARRRDGDTVVAGNPSPTSPRAPAGQLLAGQAPHNPPSHNASASNAPPHPVSPAAPIPSSASLAGAVATGRLPTGEPFVARVIAEPTMGGDGQAGHAIEPVGYTPHAGTVTEGISNVGLVDPSPSAEHMGVLVEVYSADPNRPPYAITDRAGQTISYVTPAPGVELRRHLGSEIRIRGERGFLQGLNTPHVLATAAERMLR